MFQIKELRPITRILCTHIQNFKELNRIAAEISMFQKMVKKIEIRFCWPPFQ